MMRSSHCLSFTGRICSRWAQTLAPDVENVGRKSAALLCPAHMLMLHTASGQWPVSLLQARASSAPCRSHQLQVRTLLSPYCSQIPRHQLGQASHFPPFLAFQCCEFRLWPSHCPYPILFADSQLICLSLFCFVP